MAYNHQEIEKKWQDRWEAAGVFRAVDGSEKKKFYCLIEFPYPSGAGLHIGHPRSYTALDVVSRKRRAQGYNVLYPIGWDAFGLPTENYAIKTGRKPQDITRENTDTFRRQLKSLGLSFDWSREVNTTDPAYYKWTQWMFLEFFKAGLAYKQKQPINWCLSCKSGLANEEVVNGKCERCGGATEKREKEQWMIAITKYADRLLEDLEDLDYLEKIKTQQRNWIGKSEGAEIKFPIPLLSSDPPPARPVHRSLGEGGGGVRGGGSWEVADVEVFTTRPDTIFGATFLVISPELAKKWIDVGWQASEEVRRYVTESLAREEMDRTAEGKEKTGVDTGVVAINPANGKEIPVWIADYVLGGYGTGAIMAVPAHDERDFEFAQKFGLTIRQVIQKVGASVRSFVMGAEAITEDDFKRINVSVFEKTDKGFYKVEIPRGQEADFEALMVEKMTPGFWNEYVGDEIVFLFKHKDGQVERLVMNEANLERIDRLACEFNDIPYKPSDPENYINGAIAFNDWYRPLIVHIEPGVLINSGEFDRMDSEDAKWAIVDKIGARRSVNYKLRDWVFSRQRYWGEPIPLVHCDSCSPETGGWVAVSDEQLPVVLPDVEKYEPTDTGESPLAAITDWVNTTCPTCGGAARRETDTMPNWAGSSWYFLAYAMHSQLNIEMSSRLPSTVYRLLNYWLPVDLYDGGMEHTTLHLLYSRFWNKFLFDRGHVPTSEPYARRHSHGLVLASDGTKMSKSKGNGVDPDEIIRDYGADALRMYLLFMGPFEEPAPWNVNGLVGVRRFLEKVERVVRSFVPSVPSVPFDPNAAVAGVVERALKKVSDDIESFKFNTAVSAFMSLFNEIADQAVTREQLKKILVVLCPFAPHLANECWEMIGEVGLVEEQAWPTFDERLLVREVVDIAVQVNGKARGTISIAPDADESTARAAALAVSGVQKHIDGREIVKVVYVPGRIVNIVVK